MVVLAIAPGATQVAAGDPSAASGVVTYEAFGAVGDGLADDLPAIDRSRWGVVGTNFMKHFLVENCVLSRMDVHQSQKARGQR